jgi:ribonuclease T1
VQATRTPRTAPTPSDGLATIALAKLPPEARETIRLIQRGGPFPYRQDGVTFQNREGRLPKRPSGYYKEYTVITPGSPDRGARRVISGEGGELYYTDDHYDTFKRVMFP